MQWQQTAVNSHPDHKQNWPDLSAMQLLILEEKILFLSRLICYLTILAAVEEFTTREFWYMMLLFTKE